MSQKGSSIGSDNPELKYKKALLEIQKIHNANKVLKNQSEEMKVQYERQINDLNLNLHNMEKEYDSIKQEKATIEKYYEELQLSQTELRKEYNNLEREVSYLNEVLTEQNAELKKVSAFKDEKGLSTLIASYEDKEINYRKDISRLEEVNKNLKGTYETLENDLLEERRQRFKLEDLNNNLRMEITKYKELNNNLLTKNQNIIATLLNRNSEGKQKYREAESMLSQLSRQLQFLKATRIEQQASNRSAITIESYEAVLHQKGKLQNDLMKIRQRMSEYDNRFKQGYQIEQKMKRAMIHAEQLQEECNMLKGKLILIETQDAMEGEVQFSDLKELEERILTNVNQNDPLVAIKNSSDSSHFQLMKSYILDLKEKLHKALINRKQIEKKYRSLKEKLTDKAEKSIGFEEQNKLLKGKLEGYERLTERLQFELQKSIQAHDEQITRIKNVTNTIIAKKIEEVKVANAYVRAQLDLELDKFEKTEKGLRQGLDTLKLELSTQKIKNMDLEEKYNQANEFLTIYQKKFNEITASNQEVEEHNHILDENAMRYEQLYREERSKNQALLVQKHTLTTKLAQVSQQLQKINISESQLQNKYSNVESEARKAKIELAQTRGEIESLQNILKVSKKEFQDKSRVAMLDISRTETSYYSVLEQNFNQERDKNRQLQAEIQSLKLRLERATVMSQKVMSLEDALQQKTDELNDFRRKGILTEKQISVQEVEIKDIKNEFDILRRQNNALKARLLESGQQLRKSYESKDLQSKKGMQKLTEQLASALSELRQERRVGARLQTDVQSHRGQIQRFTNFIEQGKSKEQHLYEELGQLKNSYETISDQNERLKSQLKYKNGMIESFNSDSNIAQQKIFKLNQESSEDKVKIQQLDSDLSDLKREVTGLKVYLSEIEDYSSSRVASGGWQEQRDRENVSNFVQRVKKLMKKAETSSQSTGGQYKPAYFPSTLSPIPDYLKTLSPAPDYLKNYNQPLYGTFEQPKSEVPFTDSNFSQNFTQNYGGYGGEMQFKYGDYS